MICASCGVQIANGSTVCARCRAPRPFVAMLKRRSATLSLALAVLSLPFVLAAYLGYSLVNGLDSDPNEAFALSAYGPAVTWTAVFMAAVAVVTGFVARRAALGRPPEWGGRSLALDALVAGLIMLLCNILLAFDLHAERARRLADEESSEVWALGEVVHIERLYAQSNEGLFGSPECLEQPCRCLPRCDSASDSPLRTTLWADDLARALRPQRSLYSRTFYPGAPATGVDPGRDSSSRLTGFAVVAVPIAHRRSLRTLCIDSNREACVLPPKEAPDAVGGRCPASCVPWASRAGATR